MTAAVANPTLREAAAIAYTFHLDPVDVLAEPDPFRALVRRAATKFVQDEQEKADKAARAAARRR